jgi:arginyl-tRNA synthetase
LNTRDRITSLIAQSVSQAITEGRLPAFEIPDIKVEYPKEPKFGDYATPFALETAKPLRRSPLETGQVLKEYIERSDLVSSVDVVKPGFINIFLSFDHLYRNVHVILDERERYGKSSKDSPRRVNIEFVSANPTGPLNVVSARAAALGDTLANLLEMTGDAVEREFYVNDYGNQVYLLGRSVLARLRELRGEPSAFPEDGYQGEYIRDIAAHIDREYSAEVESTTDEEALIDRIAQWAIDYNVSSQTRDLAEFNVVFKKWFREKTLHDRGDVMGALQYLETRAVIYDQEGKKVFSSTMFGDDKDRVVVRDDGRPTYLLADIAYHLDKVRRGYDLSIDIWGPDHLG